MDMPDRIPAAVIAIVISVAGAVFGVYKSGQVAGDELASTKAAASDGIAAVQLDLTELATAFKNAETTRSDRRAENMARLSAIETKQAETAQEARSAGNQSDKNSVAIAALEASAKQDREQTKQSIERLTSAVQELAISQERTATILEGLAKTLDRLEAKLDAPPPPPQPTGTQKR